MRPAHPIAIACLACSLTSPAWSQPPKTPAIPVFSANSGYADTVDMVLASPIVAIADVDRATVLKGPQAAGVAPGSARLYVEATIATLIRGGDGMAAGVTYLADIATDSANRVPKLKKQRVILLAAPVAARPGELRLSGPRAQIPWSPAAEQRIRAVLAETMDRAAPPAITGITGAFHVPGSLPGESETQIFLKTTDARPISLSILRRPGEQPRWAVSLTEMVDNSAAPPKRDSLLWYRLACGLPPALPPSVAAGLAAPDRQAAEADYALVIQGLGPCGRTVG